MIIISVRGGHYDYSSRAPENLATPLSELNKKIENFNMNDFRRIICIFISRWLQLKIVRRLLTSKEKVGIQQVYIRL
jgi:hypothetical protein